MDPNVFMQGINISILGLLFTFSALGFLILVIVGLQKLFPARAEEGKPEGEGESTGSETVVLAVEVEGDEEQEIAAVIAAAVSYLRSRSQSDLGSSLKAGRGRWWVPNRN